MYWQHKESTVQFSKLSFIKLEHCFNNERSALNKKKYIYIEFYKLFVNMYYLLVKCINTKLKSKYCNLGNGVLHKHWFAKI